MENTDRLDGINISTTELIKMNGLKHRPIHEIANELEYTLRFTGTGTSYRCPILIKYLRFDGVKKYLNEEYVKEVESGNVTWKQITTVEETATNFLEFLSERFNLLNTESGHPDKWAIRKLS